MPRPPGPEFYTFTILARCPRTGAFGIATSTRSLAVGTRVPHVRPRLGAVAIMASADPRLGYLALRLLEMGHKAAKVIDELVSTDPFAEYRQLAVIDADNNAAARTGANNRDWAGHRIEEGFIALGNVLVGPEVVDAMAEAFAANAEDDLEDRLMTALEAGRDAGGQHGGQRSAAIVVYDQHPFAHLDLRVDIHDEPVAELRRVFDGFHPFIPYYNMRSVDPRIAPYYDWAPDAIS